jgi:hypothetical protein
LNRQGHQDTKKKRKLKLLVFQNHGLALLGGLGELGGSKGFVGFFRSRFDPVTQIPPVPLFHPSIFLERP